MNTFPDPLLPLVQLVAPSLCLWSAATKLLIRREIINMDFSYWDIKCSWCAINWNQTKLQLCKHYEKSPKSLPLQSLRLVMFLQTVLKCVQGVHFQPSVSLQWYKLLNTGTSNQQERPSAPSQIDISAPSHLCPIPSLSHPISAPSRLCSLSRLSLSLSRLSLSLSLSRLNLYFLLSGRAYNLYLHL